jgi:hypothetical protein
VFCLRKRLFEFDEIVVLERFYFEATFCRSAAKLRPEGVVKVVWPGRATIVAGVFHAGVFQRIKKFVYLYLLFAFSMIICTFCFS